MEGIASKLMRCTPDIIKTVENEVEQQRLRGLEGNPGGGQGGIGGMFAPNRHSLEGRVSPFKKAVRSVGRMSDLFHSHHRAAEHGALGEGVAQRPLTWDKEELGMMFRIPANTIRALEGDSVPRGPPVTSMGFRQRLCKSRGSRRWRKSSSTDLRAYARSQRNCRLLQTSLMASKHPQQDWKSGAPVS